MKHIFYLVLTTLAFFACSPNSTPKKHLLEGYIRFDEAQGKVMAEATMKEVEGTPKLVEVPEGILFQGTVMELLPVEGVKYHHEYPAGFSSDYTFRWNDDQGKPATFTMRMNPLNDFSFGSEVVSHTKPATLQWKGPGLERGEAMVLMWEMEEGRKTIPMEIITTGTEAKIDFPASEMEKLSPGKWTMYLVRKKLSKGLVNSTTVSCRAELYSKIRAITVI